ncbi:class I SAM-dependent methyltransferase [Phyllobacterium sp. 21LDTY02-6]|uniref:phospholipid N-methyltransferase PmtA n=1 Tax=unclassified Phyllobacterium TaxID=2638441 RepID=UPI00202131A8|nr:MULTISPECIES: class I SAM-dependent methyltransferase [unclassified Phyllobacterium]MCO4317245.1 class I SAM-dependent methyltransferase [Phyllobacterium sp. 21LDTY02-6]MCX8278811.1 class I SAM-dependent methyltransferase [Phyllobacterium sp. 0TCS1.6C]MCX8293360.1 class I SAM-dependent methyltransferase [Phyllobacterium sp. 0TCS1.6A]
MTRPLGKKLAEKFDEEIRFFKGWMHGPKAVGSILPTSSVTARRMASVVNPQSGLPVLELGPGTGVITKAILQRGVAPSDLYCVEYSSEFAEHLREDFPGVNIVEGDAFDLDTTLGEQRGQKFDSVVSAVPLLNFPVNDRVKIIEDLLRRIPHGRPVVQITYGPMSPVPAGRGNYKIEHLDFIIRNVPPARLWVYRRAD